MSRAALQDRRESEQIRMIREAMEKVRSCLVLGEGARMGHALWTGEEEGTAELGKRGWCVVREGAAYCVIWRVS